jgi:hypothetical protein
MLTLQLHTTNTAMNDLLLLCRSMLDCLKHSSGWIRVAQAGWHNLISCCCLNICHAHQNLLLSDYIPSKTWGAAKLMVVQSVAILHVRDNIFKNLWFYSFWSVTLDDTIKIISITPPSVIKMCLYVYMPLHVSVDNNHHQKANQYDKETTIIWYKNTSN